MQYQHIIWDWNGTIVDDLELAVELANLELQAAGLPPLSAHQHRAAFQIPIIRYYEAIGMTMTPELAAAVDQAFHRNYDEARHRLTAFPDIFPAMQTLGTKSCKHSVLSALPHDLLTEHVEHLNLGSSFERVIGRTTTHAESKVEAGRKLIADLQLQPQHVLIIGDTIYDHEVADALGAHCALISRGHQNIERLEAARPTYLETSVAALVQRLAAERE